jgi:hypothetical protein
MHENEEREERISMEIIEESYGPEEQAIEDWHYWVNQGIKL